MTQGVSHGKEHCDCTCQATACRPQGSCSGVRGCQPFSNFSVLFLSLVSFLIVEFYSQNKRHSKSCQAQSHKIPHPTLLSGSTSELYVCLLRCLSLCAGTWVAHTVGHHCPASLTPLSHTEMVEWGWGMRAFILPFSATDCIQVYNL